MRADSKMLPPDVGADAASVAALTAAVADMLCRAAVAGLAALVALDACRLAFASAALAEPAVGAFAEPTFDSKDDEAKLLAKFPSCPVREADKFAWSCSREGVPPAGAGCGAEEGAKLDVSRPPEVGAGAPMFPCEPPDCDLVKP